VLVLSVALALEYEAVCRDPAQRIVSGLSEAEVEILVTALCAVAESVETRFLWRPQLRDPADEMVLDAAINGAAHALVTFNRKDFGQAPDRFGIALLSPMEALRRLTP
jgi:predicted nucleic acid-binding protein